MANDGGNIAVFADWMVTTLAALTSGGKAVFKTVELWKHQVAEGGSGAESFTQYAPFAFIGYLAADAAREGGYDLREVPEYGVLIGVESAAPGVAMWGDATHLGVSKIRDLVIEALDCKRPSGGDVTCDEFYYTGDIKIVDTTKRCSLQMHFETSQMNPKD